MKTKMQDTSLQAFNKFTDGYWLTQEGTVLQFIQGATRIGMDMTRQEISLASKIPINAVCGRVRKLLEKGLICVCGERFNETSGCYNEALKAVLIDKLVKEVKT